jgi:hypothetical protein
MHGWTANGLSNYACRKTFTTSWNWRAAVEALLLVVERGGPTILAHIGIMRAFNCRT